MGDSVDLLEIGPKWGVGGYSIEQQSGVARDRHQQVVEVVRDTTRQLDHGLDLLRLPEALFGLPAVGDIALYRDEMGHLPLVIPDRGDIGFGQVLGTVLPIVDDLTRKGLPLNELFFEAAQGVSLGMLSLQKPG